MVMVSRQLHIVFLSLFISVFFSSSSYANNDGGDKENTQEPEKVNWMSFEEAIAKSKTNPKKFFIDVYTDWCGWCKVMDRQTFSHPQIARYLNEKYYAIKLDAEQKEDIIFQGRTFKFVPSGRKGYHQLAASLVNNQLSYPTVVFLDEKYRILSPVPGFRKPVEMDIILKYFGENNYLETKWEEFSASYESSIVTQ